MARSFGATPVGVAIGWRLLVLVCVAGCASPSAGADAVAPRRMSVRPVHFAYPDASGVDMTEQHFRGRRTWIAMVTTYDLASQIALRRLEELRRTFTPRINVAAVVLEPPRYRVLLDTFKETLELSFPVLLADHATMEGRSPFGTLDRIPHLVLLDAEGYVVARSDGAPDVSELGEILRASSPEPAGSD